MVESRPLSRRRDRGGGVGFPASGPRKLAAAHRPRRRSRRRGPFDPAPLSSKHSLADSRGRRGSRRPHHPRARGRGRLGRPGARAWRRGRPESRQQGPRRGAGAFRRRRGRRQAEPGHGVDRRRHSRPARRQGGVAPNRASWRADGAQALAHPEPLAPHCARPLVGPQGRRRRPDRSGRLCSPPARFADSGASSRPAQERSAAPRSRQGPSLRRGASGRCPRSRC